MKLSTREFPSKLVKLSKLSMKKTATVIIMEHPMTLIINRLFNFRLSPIFFNDVPDKNVPIAILKTLERDAPTRPKCNVN